MKTIYKNKLVAGILISIGFLGLLSSCSDDHFDVKVSGTNAQTLWENMKSEAELDSFALILSNAYVMRSETDNSFNFTYADFLNSEQTITVWAPRNGTYDASSVLATLSQAKEALSTGDQATALKLYRQVETRFVRSHMARYAYNNVTSSALIDLLNGKVATYDVSGRTFNGVKLSAAASVGARNGDLHQIEGESPFMYNTMEYLRNNEKHSTFSAYLAKYDTTYFSAGESTPGAIYNGYIQYVDSVYANYNNFMSSILSMEDSMYVSIIPTDAAIGNIFTTYDPYLNYRKTYKSGWVLKSSGGEFSLTDSIDIDSIKTYAKYQLLRGYMSYSSSNFAVENQRDSAQIINYVLNADSIQSAYFYWLRNHDAPGTNSLFAGYTPQRLSNGFVFSVDQMNLGPKDWLKELTYTFGGTYLNRGKIAYSGLAVEGVNYITLNELNANPNVAGLDSIPNKTFVQFYGYGAAKRVDFKISDVYSATYNIGLIVVPPQANLNDLTGRRMRVAVRASILDEENKVIATKSSYSVCDTTKVDTVWLFQNLKFPYAYTHLPSSFDSFLRLRVETGGANSSTATPFNVAGIIIRPTELD